jgi:hypothetical protein
MLHKVTQEGADGTLKQVEFKQIMVSPANSNFYDSPVAEEESDEEEVST